MTGKTDKDFETSLIKLEQIVRELESGDTSLNESLLRFEEGIDLSIRITNRLEPGDIVRHGERAGKARGDRKTIAREPDRRAKQHAPRQLAGAGMGHGGEAQGCRTLPRGARIEKLPLHAYAYLRVVLPVQQLRTHVLPAPGEHDLR